MGKFKKSHQNLKFDLKCQHCEKVFKYESERKRHEESHSPRFSCKVCKKMFSFMSALRRHEKQHKRSGSVTCDECKHTFRDESLLKRHKQYAHNGIFDCLKCDAIFSSELALRCHMKTHKPESERRFRCSFDGCGKAFNFAHHLKHHEMTHTNTKPHFCDVCNKGFIQYHHYKEHLKKHKTWLLCPVPTCKKTFPSSYTLRKHTATHKRDEEKINDTCSIMAVKLPINGAPSISSQPVLLNPVSPIQHLDFESKCSIKDVNEMGQTAYYITSVNSIEESIGIIDTSDVFDVKNDAIAPISNCHTYLGGCIVKKDTDSTHNCLCAQMSYPIEDTYDVVASRTNNTCGSKNKVDVNPIKFSSGACVDCHCNNSVELSNDNLNTESYNRFDEIVVYKADGTIKIKEFLDVDFSAPDEIKSSNSSSTNKKDALVPSNSCKAILGKCIVSGSGTISENCLCVKMTVDDHPMLDQEIDEITPRPKM